MSTINLIRNNKVLLLLMFCIVSCSYPDSPKSVAEKFLTGFQKHDFDEAAKYGTKETGKILKQIERIEELEKSPMPLPKGNITIVSEEMEGKTAVVYFKTGDENAEEKLKLIKVAVDGAEETQWRVALTKTDLKVPDPLFGPAIPDSTKTSSF
ncbi:MAG: hypothetical protein ABI772_15520 [Bacteroidota bacterium]